MTGKPVQVGPSAWVWQDEPQTPCHGCVHRLDDEDGLRCDRLVKGYVVPCTDLERPQHNLDLPVLHWLMSNKDTRCPRRQEKRKRRKK